MPAKRVRIWRAVWVANLLDMNWWSWGRREEARAGVRRASLAGSGVAVRRVKSRSFTWEPNGLVARKRALMCDGLIVYGVSIFRF